MTRIAGVLAFSPDHWHKLPLSSSTEDVIYDDGCRMERQEDGEWKGTHVWREGDRAMFGWTPEHDAQVGEEE